ncbi:SRPBCC family protein [Halalkalicoccus sp. NIPERK01]|uniref:SRPBCC family protein n=1 Tax=Halalkalicoccus sp. NIPERK01 TaxID=3053469 RepID=UPI00256F595F|nr:SRPBCC family protein [Halalkalicoccus sp. NIPERK01]MDL5363620.1 SRPBCC family protein [Halalkalicoccus sp. NIPERK01]
MTVRVERRFVLPASCEEVWEFISDPEQRARAISVVSDYELVDEAGNEAIWYIDIPIPVIRRAARVETEDTERDPPRYVEFVGRSKVMRVTGSHRLEETDGGCRLTNEFVVDGRLPGVERFFKKNLDSELENLERTIREYLARNDRR